jgi:hypothetical protein
MAKITISQLQTSDSYFNELTATELNTTKGGGAFFPDTLGKIVGGILGIGVSDTSFTGIGGTVDESLNGNSIPILSPQFVVA